MGFHHELGSRGYSRPAHDLVSGLLALRTLIRQVNLSKHSLDGRNNPLHRQLQPARSQNPHCRRIALLRDATGRSAGVFLRSTQGLSRRRRRVFDPFFSLDTADICA
jgi:hypothetical protein